MTDTLERPQAKTGWWSTLFTVLSLGSVAVAAYFTVHMWKVHQVFQGMQDATVTPRFHQSYQQAAELLFTQHIRDAGLHNNSILFALPYSVLVWLVVLGVPVVAWFMTRGTPLRWVVMAAGVALIALVAWNCTQAQTHHWYTLAID